MRFTKLLTAGVMALALFVPSVAAAEDARIASLQAKVRELEAREDAMRERAAKSRSPQLKKESARLIKVIDAERIFLATRLQAFTLLPDFDPAPEYIDEVTARANRADRLMSTVERWFKH